MNSSDESRATSWQLAVAIRLALDGDEVAREPVEPGDLNDVMSEAWREQVLRRGRCADTLEAFDASVSPTWSDKRRAFTGFSVASHDPAGHTAHQPFTVHSLELVATRAAQRLIAGGVLQQHDPYYYEIAAERQAGEVATDGRAGAMRTRALEPLETELAPLLRRATPVGPVPAEGGPFPVFYTERALTDAARCSRRGEQVHPPVETGGVLVGFLCTCPSSGEFFAIVVEVLEALDADQTAYSLAYSPQTWARINTLLKARQQHPATRGMRILGQCHGHNFIPGEGAPPCDLCARVAVCTRSSVFVSRDDWNWNRAVFARQPWQLCHIFGLNARHDRVHGLFGLRDGRLLERGFHLLPDFHLEDH